MYLCDTVGNVWLVVRKQLVSKLSQKKEKKKALTPPHPKKATQSESQKPANFRGV